MQFYVSPQRIPLLPCHLSFSAYRIGYRRLGHPEGACRINGRPAEVGDGDVAGETPALLDASLFCSGEKLTLLPEDKPTLYASNDTVVQDTWCIEPGLSGHIGIVPERRGDGSR